MHLLFAGLAGLLFGIGLIVSGMSNPAKVLGFLDLAGVWNPSLAMVMAGAIGVGLLPFGVARKRVQSLLGAPIQLPQAQHIDRRLIGGSLLFGLGWGLAGYCPGPALASLASGGLKPLAFTLAMLAGMGIFEWLEGRKRA